MIVKYDNDVQKAWPYIYSIYIYIYYIYYYSLKDTEGGRSSAGSSSYREKLEGDRGDVIVSNEDVSMYKVELLIN